VAVGVEPVDAAAAIVAIDLAFVPARWIGPVVEAALLDASEDLVPLLLAGEGVVLTMISWSSAEMKSRLIFWRRRLP
jgi:hypothetical protein